MVISPTGKLSMDLMKVPLENSMDRMDGAGADDDEIHRYSVDDVTLVDNG